MVQVSIRLGLAAGILMLGGAGAVQAADMPVKAVPMMPASYNWTGIYGGVHAGYGRGMKDWALNYDVSGWLAGGQIGVNQQIGNLVIGIEADASWSNIKVTTGQQAFNIPPGTVGSIANIQQVGISQDMHLIKFGINYHFNSLMDVISAKY